MMRDSLFSFLMSFFCGEPLSSACVCVSMPLPSQQTLVRGLIWFTLLRLNWKCDCVFSILLLLCLSLSVCVSRQSSSIYSWLALCPYKYACACECECDCDCALVYVYCTTHAICAIFFLRAIPFAQATDQLLCHLLFLWYSIFFFMRPETLIVFHFLLFAAAAAAAALGPLQQKQLETEKIPQSYKSASLLNPFSLLFDPSYCCRLCCTAAATATLFSFLCLFPFEIGNWICIQMRARNRLQLFAQLNSTFWLFIILHFKSIRKVVNSSKVMW